jgi:hypothetical protein
MDPTDLYRSADDMETQARTMRDEADRIRRAADDVDINAGRVRDEARDLERVQRDAADRTRDAERAAAGIRTFF